MKKLTRDEVIRMCLNNTRLGFDLKLTERDVEEALGRDEIVVDVFSPMYEQNNIYIYFDFRLQGHEGALNVNLIYDEPLREWVTFFDGTGPDDAYFDLDAATNKYVVHRL